MIDFTKDELKEDLKREFDIYGVGTGTEAGNGSRGGYNYKYSGNGSGCNCNWVAGFPYVIGIDCWDD